MNVPFDYYLADIVVCICKQPRNIDIPVPYETFVSEIEPLTGLIYQQVFQMLWDFFYIFLYNVFRHNLLSFLFE